MDNSSLQILIVEDSVLVMKMHTSLVKGAGCEIDGSMTGEDAVDKASNKIYNLILMDLGLPNISGFEATHLIRQINNFNGKAPIIAVTAHKLSPDKIKEAMVAGMNGYIVKPLSATLLNIVFHKFIYEKSLMDGNLHFINEDGGITTFYPESA